MARVIALHAGSERLGKPARSRLELRHEGVVGDRHFGGDPDRAVLLVAQRNYLELAERGIELPYGSLGENLVLELDGPAATRLRPGARLRIGGALLEVTSHCSVCGALARLHPSLPKLARGRRGLYARVGMAGTVALGDEAVWLPVAVEPRSGLTPSVTLLRAESGNPPGERPPD